MRIVYQTVDRSGNSIPYGPLNIGARPMATALGSADFEELGSADMPT